MESLLKPGAVHSSLGVSLKLSLKAVILAAIKGRHSDAYETNFWRDETLSGLRIRASVRHDLRRS